MTVAARGTVDLKCFDRLHGYLQQPLSAKFNIRFFVFLLFPDLHLHSTTASWNDIGRSIDPDICELEIYGCPMTFKQFLFMPFTRNWNNIGLWPGHSKFIILLVSRTVNTIHLDHPLACLPVWSLNFEPAPEPYPTFIVDFMFTRRLKNTE